MEMQYERPAHPVHYKPPMEGAVATAEGWRHPKTGELLVSIRGLLNDKAAPAESSVVSNPVSQTEGDGNPAPQTEGDGNPADPQANTGGAEGDAQPEGGAPDGGKKDDGTEAKIFDVVVNGEVATVTILSPNNHASTKWTVNGELSATKGNTIEVPVGATFTSKSAKGEFNGKA